MARFLRKHFLNDSDGLSQRDFLLLISAFMFFTFVFIGLVMELFRTLGLVNESITSVYLQLLDMVSPVVMTIVGGVFGVTAVEKFTDKKNDKNDEGDNKQERYKELDEYTMSHYVSYENQSNTHLKPPI